MKKILLTLISLVSLSVIAYAFWASYYSPKILLTKGITTSQDQNGDKEKPDPILPI